MNKLMTASDVVDAAAQAGGIAEVYAISRRGWPEDDETSDEERSAIRAEANRRICRLIHDAVESLVDYWGINESGELPEWWAKEIARGLGIPCDERLVSDAEQAYAHLASK